MVSTQVEELLREYEPAPAGDAGDGDDADGAAVGGDLAETMAISADEFALYVAVDRDRAARGAVLAPLGDGDVPGWVRAGANSAADAAAREGRGAAAAAAAEHDADAAGRAGRKRRAPDYAGMSERTFLKLIEGGVDDAPAGKGKPPLFKAVGPNKGELRVRCKCKRKRVK